MRLWPRAWSAPTLPWMTCFSRMGPALGQVGTCGLAPGPGRPCSVPTQRGLACPLPQEGWHPRAGGRWGHSYRPDPLQLPVTSRPVCVAGIICPGLAWAGTAGTGAAEPHPPATASPLWTTPWAQRKVGLSREGTRVPPPTLATQPSPPRLLSGSEAKGQGACWAPHPLVSRPLCSLRNGCAGPGGPSGLAAQPTTACHRGLLPPLLVPHGLSRALL